MTSEASRPARPREQLMPGFLQRCFRVLQRCFRVLQRCFRVLQVCFRVLQRCFRVLQVCFRVLVHPLAVRGSRLFDDVFEGLKV